MSIQTILTHPGGAHKDELLAVCVLAAVHDAPIVRREPSEADLADASVAVVDVGGLHDPALANFDHHHFPRDHAPTCSLSLVLEHLGLYEDARRFCDWLEPAEWFDSRGPNRTAEWLGVPRRAISRLNSPIDGSLLRRFAQVRELAPDQPLYGFLKMVGEDLLEHLRSARERLDFAAAHVQRWSIPCGAEQVQALFLPPTEPAAEGASGLLASYIRAEGLEKEIAALIYPDTRGEGFGIARYEDHPQLDFTRVESQSDVRFAHKSGFVCKTTATEAERLKALVAAAWIPAPGA